MSDAAAAEEFWEGIYANGDYRQQLDEGSLKTLNAALNSAVQFYGSVKGKKVLDLGCGNGFASLFLAGQGAIVTAIDASKVAIANLSQTIKQLEVPNITPIVGDALSPDTLGKFDFVFGAMILHHLEPFALFSENLRRALNPGGKAFFFENSAANNILIWFRNHLVGKLWVTKFGDPDEHPLTQRKIDMLRGNFAVETVHPYMMFFQLASLYLLRRRFLHPLVALDDFLFRNRIGVRYSYHQYVMLHAKLSEGATRES